MSERFMTPDGKARELASLARERAEGGLADEAIMQYCDALNALPGVCTLQSCAGHRPGEISAGAPAGTRDQQLERTAHLWLWLDERTADTFYYSAWRLSEHPCMEYVAIRFQPYGRQLVELIFHGNDCGPGHLASSMKVIIKFLGEITQ